MKTAMKKLLSFVLVAMLLVSAIPFQARAISGDPITVRVKIGTQEQSPVSVACAGDSLTVQNLLDSAKPGWSTGYQFVTCWIKSTETYVTSLDSSIDAGEEVVIKIEEVEPVVVEPISIVVKVDSSDNVVWTGSKVPANDVSATVENLLSYCWNSSWDDVYEFDHAWSHAQQANVALNGSINAGDTVYIMVNKAATTTTTTPTTPTEGTANKFPYKVYLHIFTNNTVDEPAKTINITSGIALDGKVTLEEAKTVVKEYYTAKTSDGIVYDGLYLAEGNWVGNFVNDTKKEETIEDTNQMRQIREVHINLMITNATAKSTTTSSTADPTNPKTGDSIYMVMTVMGLSAAALAAVYYVSKKRAF